LTLNGFGTSDVLTLVIPGYICFIIKYYQIFESKHKIFECF